MIKFEDVTKTFGTGESALENVTLSVDEGEFVFVTGPSGSGKTTLFRLLTREILPTRGAIHIKEWNITKLPKGKVPHLRRRIGVVFQDLKLLLDRTIMENIMLPLQIAGVDNKKATVRASEVMSQIGIDTHKQKFPVQLSGGELQRVAIARAIVFTPEIVIADEPTGNLDSATSWEIIKILQDINKSGATVLMATHNTDIVKSLAKRVIALDQGKITADDNPSATKQRKKNEEEKEPETGSLEQLSEAETPAEPTVHKKHKKEGK